MTLSSFSRIEVEGELVKHVGSRNGCCGHTPEQPQHRLITDTYMELRLASRTQVHTQYCF